MNSTEKTFCRGIGANRLLTGFVSACALIFGGFSATGQEEYYVNNAIVNYPGTAEYPPVIDARNFINNSSFTVDFTEVTFLDSQPFYETYDTANYTNNGVLAVNSGFVFDTQSSVTGMHTPAANFNNSGLISCGLAEDTNDPFAGLLSELGYVQCFVNATSIVNPGEVDVGEGGLIQFTGQYVNLYQGILNIENFESSANGGGGVTGSGYAGTNYWNPGADVSANTAISGFFPIAPGELDLTDSTAYTNLTVVNSNDITRSVFILDNSGSNVNAQVYFPPDLPDYVIVQWTGIYLDPASGQMTHSYFYLLDNYTLGASTNVMPVVGIPDNFTAGSSPTPVVNGGFATPSQLIVFPEGQVSNLFDVANMTVGLGVTSNTIPNRAVTNLPGRIQIYGNHDLDMRRSQISGANYLALWSTNEFHGADGALIQALYSDIHLGVRTNSVLSVSNIMQAHIPYWSGNIVAWNYQFLAPAGTNGTTNLYSVLIIGDKLAPTLSSQQQDLFLHGPNQVISDTFTVYRTFSSDAISLTLTTNSVGDGATSFDGELNFSTPSILWQSSLPNLRYLTNYGAIRSANLINISYPTLTNTSFVLASGVLSESGTNAVRKDKVTVGTNQYLFVTTLTNAVANQVAIVPGSFDSTMQNLIAAINGGGAGGATVSYSTATTANPLASAGPLANGAFTVTALTAGTNGNGIASLFSPSTTSTNLSWGHHSTLYGGTAIATNIVPSVAFSGGAPNTAFVNNGIILDEGSAIYAAYFENGGIISNGIGGFALQSANVTLTNGLLAASGAVSLTANSLVVSNLSLAANGSLTLQFTNELTDTGVTNGNVWAVGSASVGSGFSLPVKPITGDLLGTKVTLSAPVNRTVTSVWAGNDFGISASGYTNNEAIGQMIFNPASSAIPSHNGVLAFNGAGVSNALYIDLLVLTNYATQGNSSNNYNFPWLSIGTNMTIYFAQAIANGKSVAEVIDDQSKLGANNGRLRWVYSYAGYFSSTNLYYTNLYGSITTNTVNAALAQSSQIDSDGDGIPNLYDPTPFFESWEIQAGATTTNLPPGSVRVQWTTIPKATNYVYYATNLMATNWLPFTNFSTWYFGANVPTTNAAVNWFGSPQIYINNPGLPDNSQQTNVWFYDAATNVPHFYKVMVWPDLDFEP